MYAERGRPSVPPERLLKAQLLSATTLSDALPDQCWALKSFAGSFLAEMNPPPTAIFIENSRFSAAC